MFKLQQTSLEHLDNIAACHMLCFPYSLGTKLGRRYTKKSLEWFLANDNRFLFHVKCGNKIVGYCGGFKASYLGDGSTSGMMQYAMREAFYAVIKKPYLLFHKDLVKRYHLISKNILRKIFKYTKTNTTATAVNNSKIGLVVIGVHPEYRGKGCFELLMRQFEEECRKRNATNITLSVKSTNARAIAAYKKMGWQIMPAANKDIDMFKMLG
jgi:ribosomal protein S18 acetylase RimI-like enzyme